MRLARVALAVCLGLAVSGSVTHAKSIVNGVVQEGAVPSIPPSSVAPLRPALAITINFDDVGAQCAFFGTTALRNTYSGLGVTFSGPGPNDGGAILHECSNFNVSGYSSPNFVGFNTSPGATMADGGLPVAPERMDFSQDVSSVQANVGGPNGGTVALTVYSAANVQLASTSVALTTSLQTLSLNAVGIRYAVLSAQDADAWVLDDLSFDTAATPAHGSTWGRLKTAYR